MAITVWKLDTDAQVHEMMVPVGVVVQTVVVVTGAGAGGTYTVVGGAGAVVGTRAGVGVAGRGVVVGEAVLAPRDAGTVLVGVFEVGLRVAAFGVVTVGLAGRALLGGIVTGTVAADLTSAATWLTMTPDASPAPRKSDCEMRLERLKRRSRCFELRNGSLIVSPLMKPGPNP